MRFTTATLEGGRLPVIAQKQCGDLQPKLAAFEQGVDDIQIGWTGWGQSVVLHTKKRVLTLAGPGRTLGRPLTGCWNALRLVSVPLTTSIIP